ncbi:hypothetical protein VCUG_02618 [Vavraia culicis subsp. floridensis]|uniref:DNA-directed RNA polymerase n=1 Tax=Vavraia culicis (isolate floridensis) TaxID=948595 RepID=L2GRK3_VAVCU|nr:uncharacterized protein VCUG_02618 [Vavraia culicis subsp. floridensis]ELA45893.1 hypothetical protein VCUG_02618 [Vavraia culicis subsp. floridensis]
MMGKRVNYTARTVISPDPYIATDEIGIPMHIARRLTFPERVTPFNRQRLERCVINGPIFPGAECIVENGVKRSLKYVKNRGALAKTLLKNSAVVHRHMTYGDMVLVNRQPTLHKPSLMSHRVCILNDKTIRMHYVNCNSYNADFDGDEMNIHLAQSLVARAENAYLSSTHENYALNGKPVRGLVQDYVVSVFNITLKDRLFSRSEINELLIASRELRFTITSPAVLRPKALYTGKQLVAILLSAYDLKMNYLHTNKISTLYWKEHYEESTVRFHNGYYVHGVLDKSEVGPSKDGLVHCIGMLKGFHVCNDILTAIGRMVSRYLVCYGQPLGISDFVLEKKHERIRADIFKEGMERGDGVLQGYVQEVFKDVGGGRDGNTKKENTKNVNYGIDIDNDTNTTIDPVGVINHVTVPSSSTLYNTPVTMAPMINLSKNERINLDNVIKKEMHTVTSQVGDLLIKGIETPFPLNKMANIILSGAKGSIVNFSQISGLLGQQSLEGGRVPLMSNGRSLCSFLSSNVLSGGFIFNRFLTGLSLSSFFFHCQAGREGLIDTAVKTSRSGYLQRCIVKMMEGTVVHYDTSVRDDLLVQYVYGEDGKDPNRILNERFIEMNTVKDQSDDKNVENKDWADGENITKDESNEKKCKNIDKSNTAICSTETEDKPPLKGTDMQISSAFLRQRIQPGESVGMIAAQAIGEPSTQMTLNTFHLAGCATNVTLGMPRLKEILMVGSKNVSTVIKGKITNRITFDPSTVFLKDALFYFKVVERNETDVLFVLNRDVGKDTIVRFKRMFLKEINKGMGKRVTVREIIRNNKRDVGDGLDSDNSSEDCLDSSSNGAGLSTGIDSNRGRNISISNDENDAVVENNSNETAGNTINDGNGAIFSRIYTEQELIEQIRDHSWSYNVIRVTLSACVPVNSTIEKMREKFRLLDSDITGIEINNDEVTVLGCDYHTFFNYVPSHGVYLNDYIDFNTCISNDVYNTWEVLGIEACRSVIIREIRAVFQAYGIEIDVRHLMLIADKMTVTGEYVAFNRHRMGGSVLGKMSFESTYNFLRKAYLYGCDDELEEPSARVALGLPVRNGTGMFDLLYDDK